MKLRLLLCSILLATYSLSIAIAMDQRNEVDEEDAVELENTEELIDNQNASEDGAFDNEKNDGNEEDSTQGADDLDILTDAEKAMGRKPKKSAKALAKKNRAMASVTSGDPYATINTKHIATATPVGDPYQQITTKNNIAQGDPYQAMGWSGQKTTKKEAQTIKKRPKTKKKKPFIAAQANTPIVAKKVTPPTTNTLSFVNNNHDNFTAEAQAALAAIQADVKDRENRLKLVAEEHLIDVKREMSEQAALLRKETKAVVKALKATTDKQVEALLNKAEEHIYKINEEVEQESSKLKQEAAHKALLIFDDAEKKAAQKRLENTKAMLTKTFGINDISLEQKPSQETKKLTAKVEPSPNKQAQQKNGIQEIKQVATTEQKATPQASAQLNDNIFRISAEWKNEISRKFYHNMGALKEIIVAAEAPNEAQDFLKKFDEQNQWFDLTLRSTKSTNDYQYQQLTTKQAQVERLMHAQHVADDYLTKITKNMPIETAQIKQARLNILYELTAKLQETSSHLDKSVRNAGLSNAEIKTIVKQTLNETSQQFRDISAQFPDLEVGQGVTKPQLSLAVVPLEAQKLEHELQSTKDLLTTAQHNLNSTQEELRSTEASLQSAKNDLDHERTLNEELAQQKELLTQEKAKAQEEIFNIKTTALDLLNDRAYAGLEVELALTATKDINQKLSTALNAATKQNEVLQNKKNVFISEIEAAKKEAFEEKLLHHQNIARIQKTARVIQKQARSQIRDIKEASYKQELSLTADLQNAHETIATLVHKRDQLALDLEIEHKKAVQLKEALNNAHHEVSIATNKAISAEQTINRYKNRLQEEISLRKEAEIKRDLVQELTEQTLSSFLPRGNKSSLFSKQHQKLLSSIDQSSDDFDDEEDEDDAEGFEPVPKAKAKMPGLVALAK